VFFPISRIAALQQEILNFQQEEKETIGAAWDRFLTLSHSSPDLSIPNHALLQQFWLGLSKESALQLDITAGGSFTHKTTDKGEALLDQILENTPPLEPIQVEPLLRHEEASSAEVELSLPKEELLPEPEDPKEDPEPIDLPPFDDDLFEDFGNTSNYFCQKKPPTPNPPSDLLDKEFLRKYVKELSAILSTESLEETEQL
jgi:hypothetical protein